MSRFDSLREPDPRQPENAPQHRAPRHVYSQRDHAVRLDESEIRSMKVVGAFRAVDAKNMPAAKLERLVNSGLMQRQTVYLPGGGQRREVLCLTPKGRDVLRSSQDAGDAQRYWSGMVKPNEVEHDLAIYDAYQTEARAIQKTAGSVRRVVLDYEFKSHINRQMNRADGPTKEARRKELAEEYELPIVDGTLMLPDLRIEYIDADGREQHIDVEVMTRQYRGSHRAGKMRSGFRLHDASRPGAAVKDHSIDWL